MALKHHCKPEGKLYRLHPGIILPGAEVNCPRAYCNMGTDSFDSAIGCLQNSLTSIIRMLLSALQEVILI